MIPAFPFQTRNYIVLLHAMAMPAHGDDFMVPFLERRQRYPEMDWSGWMVIVQKTVHGAVDKIAKFSCISLLQSVLFSSDFSTHIFCCKTASGVLSPSLQIVAYMTCLDIRER